MQDLSHTKYLGLPSITGRSKKVVFVEIKDKVCKKLAGWKGKLLSLGGKEILIKAVAQAVPTYAMSCFQLPKSLCDDLEKMMRSFRSPPTNRNAIELVVPSCIIDKGREALCTQKE